MTLADPPRLAEAFTPDREAPPAADPCAATDDLPLFAARFPEPEAEPLAGLEALRRVREALVGVEPCVEADLVLFAVVPPAPDAALLLALEEVLRVREEVLGLDPSADADLTVFAPALPAPEPCAAKDFEPLAATSPAPDAEPLTVCAVADFAALVTASPLLEAELAVS